MNLDEFMLQHANRMAEISASGTNYVKKAADVAFDATARAVQHIDAKLKDNIHSLSPLEPQKPLDPPSSN